MSPSAAGLGGAMLDNLDFNKLGLALAALSALSAAAFGLLDAFKFFGGGLSNVGLTRIYGALHPFRVALLAALGKDEAGREIWRVTVRSNWLNGMQKPQQKAVVSALLKLGLSEATAPALAVGGRVDPEALAAAARKLERGTALTEADLNVLGRMTATLEAILDAAYERAEHQYRNVSRFAAGVVAVGLALAANAMMGSQDYVAAVAVGLVAVPVAPVAKDLTSALSAAMRALKAARAV